MLGGEKWNWAPQELAPLTFSPEVPSWLPSGAALSSLWQWVAAFTGLSNTPFPSWKTRVWILPHLRVPLNVSLPYCSSENAPTSFCLSFRTLEPDKRTRDQRALGFWYIPRTLHLQLQWVVASAWQSPCEGFLPKESGPGPHSCPRDPCGSSSLAFAVRQAGPPSGRAQHLLSIV